MIVEGAAATATYPVRVDGRTLRVRIARRMVSVTEPLTCSGRPGQLVPEFHARVDHLTTRRRIAVTPSHFSFNQ